MHNLEMISATFGTEDDRVVATQMVINSIPNRKTTYSVVFDESNSSVVLSLKGKRHSSTVVVGKKGRINWEVARKHEAVRTGSECQLSDLFKLISLD